MDSRVSGVGSSLPDHQLGQLGGASSSSGSTVATVVPARMTVMASATDSTSSSLWEMKMTVMPSRFSSREVAEQLVDLLRHQHRGRLVEDEDAGAPVEHLEDLDPLALADAERLDQLVGVDGQAVGDAQLGDAPAGRAEVDAGPGAAARRRG